MYGADGPVRPSISAYLRPLLRLGWILRWICSYVGLCLGDVNVFDMVTFVSEKQKTSSRTNFFGKLFALPSKLLDMTMENAESLMYKVNLESFVKQKEVIEPVDVDKSKGLAPNWSNLTTMSLRAYSIEAAIEKDLQIVFANVNLYQHEPSSKGKIKVGKIHELHCTLQDEEDVKAEKITIPLDKSPKCSIDVMLSIRVTSPFQIHPIVILAGFAYFKDVLLKSSALYNMVAVPLSDVSVAKTVSGAGERGLVRSTCTDYHFLVRGRSHRFECPPRIYAET